MSFVIDPQVQIGHVHLKVKDAAKLTAFYTSTIGFSVLAQEGNRTLLTADGHSVLLVLEEEAGLVWKPTHTTGLYHFAILLPTRADLACAIQHLANTRYPIQGASDHIVSEALYLADPEGNGIEIYVDRPREQWEGRVDELMGTEALQIEDLLASAGDAVWNGLPKQTTIGHMHLHVPDLEAAEQFYVSEMGFELQVGMANHARFIAAGGYHHHLGLNTWAGPILPPANSTGLYMYSLLFSNESTLAELLHRLEQCGRQVEKVNGVAVVQDAMGQRIELRVTPLGRSNEGTIDS